MAVSACSGFSGSLNKLRAAVKAEAIIEGGTVMAVRRKSKSAVLGLWIIILLLCVVASLIVLFSRVQNYSVTSFENVIPLIAQKQNEAAEISSPKAAGEPAGTETADSTQKAPAFVAHDEKVVWQTNTQVDIFKFAYDENGRITVKSNAGRDDKLIAPGTSNRYVFTFENNGNVPLDYTMTMEAWIEGTENWLPVRARVWDYQNRYLLGNPAETEDVLELNTVQDDAVLGAGRYAYYTLEWEWPFEQGFDEYDTMLGNLAADGDLTLTVRITTMAQYDESPDDSKISDIGLQSPHTGDNMPVKAIAIVLAASVLLALIALFSGKKQKDDEDEQTAI